MINKKNVFLDKRKLLKFINDYYSFFLPELQVHLDNMLDNPNQISSYIMRQIYSYLQFIPSNQDCHRGFVNFLETTYSGVADKKILDIGGGPFPTLPYLISRAQRNKCGTITVYDSMLINTKIESVKSVIQNIDENTDISTFDLITGFKPCEATKLIISKANANGIPFAILLCDCIHDFGVNQDLLSNQQYISFLLKQYELYTKLAEQTLPDDMDFNITSLPQSYNYPLPLIYTLKRK